MKKGRRGVGHFVPTSHKPGSVCAAQRSPFSRRQRGDERIQCGSNLTARKQGWSLLHALERTLARQSASINGLTASERRVLLLIGESKTNHEIAGSCSSASAPSSAIARTSAPS
jgi:hypothetical protein